MNNSNILPKINFNYWYNKNLENSKLKEDLFQ